ncbi:MAG: hypothetical protein IPJ17_08670 [Holophagales bacterium]|nr:MAG: hypothetical protein IPJ17_08670 [Holophagales bacterium]
MPDQVLAAVIGAVAGLLGAIVGAVTAGFATKSLEEKKWRRDQSERLRDLRREVYSRFLSAVGEMIEQRARGQEPTPDSRARFLSALADTEILSTDPVRRAAIGFAGVVGSVVVNGNHEAFPTDAYAIRRIELLSAVKLELGIASGTEGQFGTIRPATSYEGAPSSNPFAG